MPDAHTPEGSVPDRETLAFIGGTGPEGRGLALRFAVLGHDVVIGSRSRERAEEAAVELRTLLHDVTVSGFPNRVAAERGDTIFLTVPYRGLADVVPEIRDATRGKVVISAVAPLEFVEGRLSPIAVPAGSAAQEIQDTLPEARVVSAFQTIDAHRLQDLDADLDTDIVVCSDDMQARRHVIAMTRGLPGVRAFSGGRLVGSRYVEELTALLITINRIYKVHSGMRLTGIEQR